MNTAKRLTRFLVMLLAALTALGVFLLPPQAEAATEARNKTTFDVQTRVENCAWGGTDSNVYFKVYYANGKTEKWLMDKSWYNDFERGDKDIYTFKCDYPYWFITAVAIYNSGSDAMCIDWVNVVVNHGHRTIYRDPHKKWVEKSEYKIDIDQSSSKERSVRQVQSGGGAYNTFTNAFGKTVYLTGTEQDSAGKVTWTPQLDNDGLFSAYNPYLFNNAPSLSYKIYVASKADNRWLEANSTFKKLFSEEYGEYDGNKALVGFSYKPSELYKNMCTAQYYAMRLDVTLTYPKEGSTSDRSKTVSYYVYRKQFELGAPTVVSSPAPYRAMQGSKLLGAYFNSANSSVQIQIPVLGGDAHANYDADAVAKNLRADVVRLYYGGGKNDFLTGTVSYKSPASVLLTFPIPAGIDDTVGMQLVMKGVKSAWRSGVTYDLYCRDAYTYDAQNNPSPRKITGVLGGSGDTLGDGAYYAGMTDYKLDNVAPTIELNEDGQTGISGTWKQSVTLVTAPDDVKLFPLGSSGGEGYFRMELLSGGSPIDFYRVTGTTKTKVAGTAGLLVPTVVGRKTQITLPAGKEAKDLTVRLTARDLAGNEYTKTVSGLNLDTRAPEVSVKLDAQPQAADESRTVLFRFTISELSGTGRVNYCFVPTGEALPSETEGKRTSGVIDSFVGEWGFIEQSDVGDSSVVMKLNKGEGFEGKLYYYAKDEAGNQSKQIAVPVSVNNLSAECTVTVAEYDHPLPEYDVSFTPGKDCKVYYRYATPAANGGYYRRPYVAYDGSVNPGAYAVESVNGAAQVTSLLNGQQILEYKVVNEASGNVAYFEGALGIPLTFDNTAPAANISQMTSGLSIPAHTFLLTASDVSGVASASYRVETADGTETVTSGDLTITEGADTLYTVLGTAELGLGNGSYILTLTATDRNGQTAEVQSAPFSIRTAAPVAELAVDGEKPEGTVVVNQNASYLVSFFVTEDFTGAAAGHSVYWRASTDGTAYGEWKKLDDLAAEQGVLVTSAWLDTPLALNEGLNTLYFQLMCAENEKRVTGSETGSCVLTLEPVTLLLDITAPTARWSVGCGRNNEAITGTLTVSDDLAARPTVQCAAEGVTLTPSEEDENVYALRYEPAGAPADFDVTVTDDAGNETAVTVSTALLDIMPPTITIDAPQYVSYGERTDATVRVTISEPAPGSIGAVDIALGEQAAEFGLVQESETEPGVWTVYFRGFTGSETITVTAADDLGNEASAASAAVSVSSPAVKQPELISQPAYAQADAPVVFRFNVPAVAATTKAEAEERAEEAARKRSFGLTDSCQLFAKADGSGEIPEAPQTFSVWVVPEYGEPAEFTVAPATIFGKKYDLYIETTQNGVPVAAGTPLVVGTHTADPSDPADYDRSYRADVTVETYSYLDENGSRYRSPMIYLDGRAERDYDYAIAADTSVFRVYYDEEYNPYIIDNDVELSLIWLGDQVLPYTVLSAGDERVTDDRVMITYDYGTYPGYEDEDPDYDDHDAIIRQFDPRDYDDKGTLLIFDTADEENATDWSMVSDSHFVSYPHMTFRFAAGAAETNGGRAKLNIGMVDMNTADEGSEPAPYYVRSPAGSIEGGKPCTVEVRGWPGLWMNQVLTLDHPLITVQPTAEWTLTQNTLAPEATLRVDAAGHGAEIRLLKVLKYDGAAYTVEATWDAADHAGEEREDAETPVLSCIVTEADASSYVYYIYVENEYGLSTLSAPITAEVHSTPITVGDDFTVEIDGQSAVYNDERGAFVLASEPWCQSAEAKLVLTAEGVDRGLTAVNSDGLSAVLTPEHPSFTFALTDRFGYTGEVTVQYGSFDLTAPTLAYALAETAKTNQPFAVTVTVTDGESGVGSVTLSGPGGPVALTEESAGTWTGTIERSGSYLLRAEDNYGNRKQASFTVDNIDTVKPEATVEYSIPASVLTQDSVTATLRFSKPNVTITKAEGNRGSFTLDRSARTVTFTANDAVTVFFRDDFGNEGTALLTVDNIYSDPPMLAPVVTPSGDKLSVRVSFDLARDGNGAPRDVFHKLEDLTVIHNGVAYAAVTEVKDETAGTTTRVPAAFLLREDGVYTFTVVDRAGLMQLIRLELKGIDRNAPVVKAVTWSYTYLDENGEERSAAYDLDTVLNGLARGVGYRIADDLYARTGGDVAVTVETDMPTAIVGAYRGDDALPADGDPEALDYDASDAYTYDVGDNTGLNSAYWKTKHELIYRENGLYVFNLEKLNGLSTHYGIDVEIIDKTPPVITLTNPAYMMFVEGRDKGSIRDRLSDYAAEDVYLGERTVLTDKVTVDFGGLDPDDLAKNTFDKSAPYTVSYTVTDAAGNETTVTRTVVLVGINDVLVTVDGILPDANMMAECRDGSVDLQLVNFSGVAYAAYAPGMYTLGQMKSMGTLLPRDGINFHSGALAEGWYTFFIQTETRDYFNIYVFVG